MAKLDLNIIDKTIRQNRRNQNFKWFMIGFMIGVVFIMIILEFKL